MAIFWYIAGGLGILVAGAHCYLGATQVIPPITGVPESVKNILLAIFLISGLYWAIIGAALIWQANQPVSDLRNAIFYTAIFVYGTSAAANAWATSGQHFGWMVLAGIVALITIGR